MHTFGDIVTINHRVLKKHLKGAGAPYIKSSIQTVKGRKYVILSKSDYYGYMCVDLANNKRHLPHQILRRIRKANPAHVAKLQSALWGETNDQI